MMHNCRLVFRIQTKSFSKELWVKIINDHADKVDIYYYFNFCVPFCYFQHQPDLAIGVHLMDRYTFYLLEFLEDVHPASKTNMNDLVRMCVFVCMCMSVLQRLDCCTVLCFIHTLIVLALKCPAVRDVRKITSTFFCIWNNVVGLIDNKSCLCHLINLR